MKFTVLLARPDFVSNAPNDTLLLHVEASTPAQACAKAQVDAWIADCGIEMEDDGTITNPSDLFDNAADWEPLLVVAGHLMDLSVSQGFLEALPTLQKTELAKVGYPCPTL